MKYFDQNGKERSLEWMVKNEPEWACSRIRHADKIALESGRAGYFNGFKDGYEQCSYDEDRGDWTDDDDALNLYSTGKANQYADSIRKGEVE